jgi:hypothetical protein
MSDGRMRMRAAAVGVMGIFVVGIATARSKRPSRGQEFILCISTPAAPRFTTMTKTLFVEWLQP